MSEREPNNHFHTWEEVTICSVLMLDDESVYRTFLPSIVLEALRDLTKRQGRLHK